MNIVEALSQMDVLDDDQWTQEGSPKLEVVSELVGQKVSRPEVISAAPKFTRQNPVLDIEKEEEPDVVQQEAEAEEVIDTGLLEEYLSDDPMLPEEFVQVFLPGVPSASLQALEKVIQDQQQHIEDQFKLLEELRRRVKFNLSFVRNRIRQEIPDVSNQEAIRIYIEQSQKARARKALQIQEVLGGLKPSDLAKLDPRAAIDRAFARKTSRGANRPTR